MIRATKVRPASSWSETPTDTVVLEFDDRHRRRTVMSGVQGLSFLLDLPDAVMLRGGDALELEDGRLVEVVSAPEPLLEVRAATPEALVRLSWHIGNRHLPAQVTRNALRIRQDHVIEDMLSGLGAKLVQIEAPFDPEGGAYATAGAHQGADGHHHHGKGHHAHDHHDHGPKHGHKHDDGKHEHKAHKHEPKEHKHDHKGHGHHDHHDHGHDKHDHHGPGGKHGHKHDHDH